MELVVALAARFTHSGSLEDLAARVGAISSTEGLPYWSTTDQIWRPLISAAFAVEDAAGDRARPDFTAQEILSGKRLYFAQDDTRSSSLNVYSLTALAARPDWMVIEIENMTRIRFGFLTLFEPRALASIHIIDRLDGDLWGYYGLSAVRDGTMAGNEKSLINRAAAFYRFLTGTPPDQEPPLAP